MNKEVLICTYSIKGKRLGERISRKLVLILDSFHSLSAYGPPRWQ